MRYLLCSLALALAACGDVERPADDAEPPATDGDVPPDAAPPDGPPPLPDPKPSRTTLTAGGTVTGGGFSLDVQIGQPFAPAPASGGAYVVSPQQPINP